VDRFADCSAPRSGSSPQSAIVLRSSAIALGKWSHRNLPQRRSLRVDAALFFNLNKSMTFNCRVSLVVVRGVLNLA
jgi:hypothetical protein